MVFDRALEEHNAQCLARLEFIDNGYKKGRLIALIPSALGLALYDGVAVFAAGFFAVRTIIAGITPQLALDCSFLVAFSGFNIFCGTYFLKLGNLDRELRAEKGYPYFNSTLMAKEDAQVNGEELSAMDIIMQQRSFVKVTNVDLSYSSQEKKEDIGKADADMGKLSPMDRAMLGRKYIDVKRKQ